MAAEIFLLISSGERPRAFRAARQVSSPSTRKSLLILQNREYSLASLWDAGPGTKERAISALFESDVTGS
jgi:hypothetical protein